MPSKHWPIGGSSAVRTVHCPGWALAVKIGYASNPPGLDAGHAGVAAERGTLMHSILEACVRDSADPQELIGQIPSSLEALDIDAGELEVPRLLAAIQARGFTWGTSDGN